MKNFQAKKFEEKIENVHFTVWWHWNFSIWIFCYFFLPSWNNFILPRIQNPKKIGCSGFTTIKHEKINNIFQTKKFEGNIENVNFTVSVALKFLNLSFVLFFLLPWNNLTLPPIQSSNKIDCSGFTAIEHEKINKISQTKKFEEKIENVHFTVSMALKFFNLSF